LTDIPATYNGKYAYFEAENSSVYIVGCQSVNMSTSTINLVQISNGRASLPMWIVNEAGSISRYSGNDTFTISQNDRFGVLILEKATLTEEEPIASVYFTGSLVFSNGSATKSANDGTIMTD
jgi:hypothetical protein